MSDTTISEIDCRVADSFDRKILIIDDVPLVGKVATKQLKSAGFDQVRFESNPRLAMEVIREYKPDMILLDINMPGLSGIELLKQIRADSDLDRIIVLMLSAAGRSEQFESLELGALGFMQKPVTAVDLVQTVTSKFGIAKRLGIQ